jgi:hypothetical protein
MGATLEIKVIVASETMRDRRSPVLLPYALKAVLAPVN